ncbi:MAG TPA: hypothetical protein VGN31_00130 [Paraburkholderia sp.]
MALLMRGAMRAETASGLRRNSETELEETRARAATSSIVTRLVLRRVRGALIVVWGMACKRSKNARRDGRNPQL